MRRLNYIVFMLFFYGLMYITPVFAQDSSSARDLVYQYAVQGNLAQLLRLKELGYSLDALDEHGNTAYCQAVWMQQQKAIGTLRAAGVDKRPACLKKIPVVTAEMIYDAADDKDLDQLILWKKQDVYIDIVDRADGNSALCKAIYEYNCPAIETLMRAGAQEAQACMRRIPQSVREKLDCRPLEINWDAVGYTVLGLGLVGGTVALLIGSGGGGGNPVCPPEQRWIDDKCVSCATCWLDDVCISQEKMTSEGYNRDETDASCWQVAPPPIKLTDSEMQTVVAEIRSDPGYSINQTAFDMIKLAYAHARGYTGYYVDRKNKDGTSSRYGRLTNGQVTYSDIQEGKKPESITTQKTVVAILSSGTVIGEGGTQTKTNTDVDSTGEVSTTTTTSTTINVWDWTKVDPHFYEKDKTRQEQYTPNTATTTYAASKMGTVSTLGEADTSFALNNQSQPFGFNFDEGVCAQRDGIDCWGSSDGTQGVYQDSEGKWHGCGTDGICGTDDDDEGYFVFFDGAGNMQYMWYGKYTGQPAGLHSNLPTTEAEKALFVVPNIGYVGATGSIANLYAQYTYDKDYYYDINDPSPHYSSASSSDAYVRGVGTFTAGLVASLNQNLANNNMYGVAYNSSVLPVVADIWYALSYDTFNTIITASNTTVLLNDRSLESSRPSNTRDPSKYPDSYYLPSDTGHTHPTINDAIGAFTRNGSTYTSYSVADIFGTDTLAAFQRLYTTSHNVVYVTPAGSNASNTVSAISHTQPILDASIPLLTEFNGTTTWTASSNSMLPILAQANPLKNLFVVVTGISSLVENESGNTASAELYSTAQACGISAAYCVSAPGSDLWGPSATTNNNIDPQGTIEQHSATTISASIVAGAVALLQGAYPHLSSQQIVDILFKTATYIEPTQAQITAYNVSGVYQTGTETDSLTGIVYHYNSIFGRGVINLDAATSPVGGLKGLWVYRSTYTNAHPILTSVSSTRLVSPSTMSVGLSSVLPATFVAFDTYDRPFEMPTSMLFQSNNKRQAKSLADFKAFMSGRDEISIKPTENFSMSYLSRSSTLSSPMALGLLKMQAKFGKASFGMFYTENTQKSFGSYITRKLNNPFVQMREAYGLNTGWQFNSKWSVDASWITGKNGFYGDDTFEDRSKTPENNMQAFTTNVSYRPIDTFGLKFSTGIMREFGSSLGMVSSGAFGIDGAKTYYVGAGISYMPLDNLRFDAMYYYGQTHTQYSDGLISLTDMYSDGFALTAEYDRTKNSLFGFQISSPLRVKSGTMNVSLPVGRHFTEDIFYYDNYAVDMSPTSRELDFSLYIKEKISQDVLIQTELGTRLHPDHRADAVPDYRAFVGVRWVY